MGTDREAVTRSWLAYAGDGLEAEAEKLLRASLERWPDDAELHHLLGSTIAARPECAAEVSEHAHATARLEPDDAVMLMHAARLLVYVRELEGAERYIRRAMDLAGDDFPFPADLLRTAGTILSATGRADDAEQALRGAFELEPDGVGIGKDLATHLMAAGRAREALDVTAEALRHRPADQALMDLRDRLLGELRT